jgi:heme-degrading monooxygenase HmoA
MLRLPGRVASLTISSIWCAMEVVMLVRMWHGVVTISKALAYRKFLNERAIPDYRSVEGNVSVHVLERKEREIIHFITLTFWQSFEATRRLAGEDIDVAKYYPEDKNYLIEFEPHVVHDEVVGQS